LVVQYCREVKLLATHRREVKLGGPVLYGGQTTGNTQEGGQTWWSSIVGRLNY